MVTNEELQADMEADKDHEEKLKKKDPLKELNAENVTLKKENEQLKGFNQRCIRKLETIAGILQI